MPLKKPVLKAKKLGSAKVKLSWKKQTAAAGYEIQYKKGKGKYKLLKKLKKNKQTTFQKGKLKKGTYTFRVRAYNKAKKSKWSKAVKIKI